MNPPLDGEGLLPMVVALAVYSVPGFARVARGEVLRIKHLEFITAARAIGGTETIRLGVVILVGASLGFLGAGGLTPHA